MDGFRRYAIYYLPEPGPLADFGAEWLGWDALDGRPRPHPALNGTAIDIAALTETPRKYGFHGTVKPPFHLAGGTSASDLRDAAAALCAEAAPVQLDGLELASLGRFLALRPEGDPAPLAALAARVVRDLDRFRAPPSEAELARRRNARLSPAQEANLTRWGYPYVMDDFRFHMTLTGSIADEGLRERTLAALTPLAAPVLPRPFRIDSLCLAGADDSGRFRLIERLPLGRG